MNIHSEIYDIYYPSYNKKIKSKSEIDYEKYNEKLLLQCFLPDKIFEIFNSLKSAIKSNIVVLNFLATPKPFGFRGEEIGSYSFDHLVFKYTVYISTIYINETNSRLTQIQFKVSNDGFYYKNLNFEKYKGEIPRYENMHIVSGDMLNDIRIKFEECFEMFGLENNKFVGYYSDEKLRMEYISRQIKQNINIGIYLTEGNLLDKIVKHNEKFNEIFELSITFEPGYPIINKKEYINSHSELREYKEKEKENKISGEW